MKKNKHTYIAALTYKTLDEFESRPMNEKYARVIMDIYMTPEQFAAFIKDFALKTFTISLKQ